jgi:succinate-semialdehyde dehydrogenase / glutarate-semialdehyde dehydrogenase
VRRARHPPGRGRGLRARPHANRAAARDPRGHPTSATIASAAPTGLLIGSGWTDAEDGRTLAVEDPATGGVLAEVADASPPGALAALDAADATRESWAATTARERAEILRRAFELVIERGEDLARLITLEMGKPLAEANACDRRQ